jgi:hypothetical protein
MKKVALFTARGFSASMIFGTAIEQRHFLTWERAREKFNLTPMEIGDWIELTGNIAEQWRHKLEDDSDITHHGQWIGFYANGEEDPTFVLQCVTGFSPPCMQLHNLSMPLLLQCFMVGTRSRCLNGKNQLEIG